MKWKKVKLTEICKPKQWKNLPISELTEVGYPVYGANGIIGKYKEYNHEQSTLAITCRGATSGTINITQPKSYITSNAMALNELSDEIDQMFLYYALNKRGFKDVITGAAQPQITREGLSKITIDIPERKEDQLHIANLLSKAENLIAHRKESIRLLDEFLKSTFLEMFGDPVRNDKGWEKVDCDRLFQMKLGKMLSAKNYTGESLMPYLRNVNVKWGEIDLSDVKEMDFTKNESELYSLKAGDILVCEGGEVGKTAILNNDLDGYCFQNALHRLRVKDKTKIKAQYFYWVMFLGVKNGMISKHTIAVTIAHFTMEKFKKLKIPVPSIALQTQFAHIVEKTEALKTQYQQSLTELENLYGSLSQKAFKEN